ncbi:MAG: aminotransferase class I/II-fold pyridoxal phosphate-dependent enzyme [Candidatus Hodarchaeales archaeon]|jgi:aspartate/methionine/tyrosine aminotransferase
MNTNSIQRSIDENLMRFGYSGILKELERLANNRPSYLHLSNCDPPVYNYVLDETILKKINNLQISQYTGYPNWNGDETLRTDLSNRVHKICKADLPPDKIVLTYGVSEGFPLTFDSLFHQIPGSVAIPDPSYIPLMVQANRFGKAWFYPCDEDDDWNPDLDQLSISLEKHPETKAIVIITPNSPCGAVYPEKILKELVNIAGQFNLIIITDEIYDSLSFENFSSPLQYADEVPVVYLNGFSKVHRLPGYRLGYLGWYDPLDKLPEFWNYLERLCRGRMGVTVIAQEIAKLALQEPEGTLNEYIKSVHEKHIFLTKHLQNIKGLSVVPAKGGTYVFPRIEYNISDEELVKHLIRDHGILVTPGSAYGPTVAPGHLRFVTLAPEEALLEGVQALDKSLRKLK